MTEETGLTRVVIVDPIIASQNEIIAQLVQQIAELKVEIQQARDLSNLAITANTPSNERREYHPPPPNPIFEPIPNNLPIASTQKTPIIDLIPQSNQATTSYQVPQPLSIDNTQTLPPKGLNVDDLQTMNTQNSQAFLHVQSSNPNNTQIFPPIYQAPEQYTQNSSLIQPLPRKTTFCIPTPNESRLPYTTGFELDHYEEKEKERKFKEEMTRESIKEEIAKAMRQFHLTPDVAGLSYKDLCIHPDLDLPEGFKVPKFDCFNETGNPLAHLRAYCDQLVGAGRNEALLMRIFSRSLSGEALEWFTSQEMKQWSDWNAMAKDFVERFAYNVEIVPDRYSVEKIKQRSTESYRDFAYRWRKEAARVRPPMTEKEIVEVFVRIQEPEFY